MFARVGKTFRACDLGTSVITTMDSQNMQAVLATSFDSFIVDPARHSIGKVLLDHGVFTLDGEPWKHARGLVNRIFAKKQVTDLEAFRPYYDQFLASVPVDGSTVDLQPLFKRLYINYSSEFLFGIPVTSLFPDDGAAQIDEFASLFRICLGLMGRRLELGRFNILRGRDREWKEASARFRGFVMNLIHKANNDREARAQARSEGRYVLVDELLGETGDPEQVYSPLLNVYLPAQDSIAIVISNILFFLARHPSAWTKLRTDVLAHTQAGHVTYENLKAMKYLQNTMREGLRLKAPAGRSIRAARVDCVLPRGGGPKGDAPIFIPEGTQIDLNFHAMHHDPGVWGADVEDFRPERWERLRPGWTYIPFLGGGRTCPAREMVLTHCGYILARLAQDFAMLERRDPELRYVEEIRNTMESRNGCKVALIRE